MKSKRKVIIGILAFIIVLGAAYISYNILSEKYNPTQELQNEEENTAQENEKNTAPDFMVYDADGNEVNLSDFFGRPIVLNFWASWCPPCKGELPDFNNAYINEKDKAVFFMVDLVDGQRETQQSGQSYIANQGYELEVYFDTEQQAAVTYGISSIPTTILIDSDSNIVKTYIGAIDEDTLKEAIALIAK
jgi:thiol-disulfide isomerase/thioredoxin